MASNVTLANWYHTKLNVAEKVYGAQRRYTGGTTAQNIRTAQTAQPSQGVSRVFDAARLGGANGSHNVSKFVDTWAGSQWFRDASITGVMGTVAQYAPQLPSSVFVPFIGNITTAGGAVSATVLVGSGVRSVPNPNSGFVAGVENGLKGLATHGVAGTVPAVCAKIGTTNDWYLSSIGYAVACVTRGVLEVPRTVLALTSTALYKGAPALIGATVGFVGNGAHAMVSSKPVNDLWMSGSALGTRVA